MSTASVAVLSIIVVTLALVAFGPDLATRMRRRPRRRARLGEPNHSLPDPGRELRAERRAEQLLRSVLDPADYEAYRALGFLHVYGTMEHGSGPPSYGYLIYPHKPLVSYNVATGELLNEHCVSFPDRISTDPEFGDRLPDADDVLAKWMALRGDERALIRAANMHLPGRQLDPGHVRRDLVRMTEWTGGSPTTSEGHLDVA